MADTGDTGTQAKLGAHGEAISTLKEDLRELRSSTQSSIAELRKHVDTRSDKQDKELAAIKQLVARSQGGLIALLKAGGLIAVISSAVAELIHALHGGK